MIIAENIMSKDLIAVSPDMEITGAAKILIEKGINGVPVVDRGRLVGILCQSDLVAQQKKLPIPSFFTLLDGFIPLGSQKHFEKAVHRIAATTVSDVMTPHPITATPETNIEEIASLMLEKNIHTIPVMDKDEIVGIIGKEDILKTMIPATETHNSLKTF